MTRALRVWPIVAMAFAMLVAQLAWIAAVPPFRGMDEWDHAYRAAAVAQGQWQADPTSATRGTGAILHVPADLVEAARPECERLEYTGPPECVGTPHGDHVDVASGAGRYAPFYYALIGYPSLPFSGADALYAMRVTSALACAALLVLALVCIRRWATGPAPFLGLAIGLTPSVLYAGSIAAPNGLEMMAGAAFWAALIGLGVARDRSGDTLYLAVAAVSGMVLVASRSLGPLWCLLIVGTCLVALPVSRHRVREILTQPSGLAAVAAVAISTLVGVGWTLSQGALRVGSPDVGELDTGDRLGIVAEAVVSWPLQAIAAFPYRDQPAPITVYVAFLALAGVALVVAIRGSTARMRVAFGLSAVGLFVIPVCISLATVDSYGNAWQGRYALPYGIGLMLLAGLAWEQRGLRPGARLVVPALFLYVIGQILGPLRVLRNELEHSPLAGTGAWPAPPVFVVPLVIGVSTAALWFAASRAAAPVNGVSAPSREQVHVP